MSHYEETRVACTPVAEGVRFEVGHASACAVRNEQRDISVRVRRRGHFLWELLGRVPLVRGVIRLFAAIGNLLGGIGEAERLKPQSVIRGSAFTRQFAALFRTTPQSLIGLLDGFAIPLILLALVIGLPMLAEQGLLALGDLPRFAVNTICLAFRIAGAVLSIYFICRLKLVSRLCMYRGASAKVFNAYEAYGPNLSHEDALLSSRLTDKSDGAFLIAVLLAVEAIQLALRCGSCDVDDVLLNLAGAVTAYFGIRVPPVARWLRRRYYLWEPALTPDAAADQ